MTKQQDIHGRVADLESLVDGLQLVIESELRQADNRLSRNPTLGITAEALGSYPVEADSPNVFPFRFLDSTFTELAGNQALTNIERQDDSVFFARTLGSSFIAEGTVVQILKDNNRYWMIEAGAGNGLPTCTDPGQILYCDDNGDYALTDPPDGGDGYFFHEETDTVKTGPVPIPAQLWWSEVGTGAEIRRSTLIFNSDQTVLTTGEDTTLTLAAEAINKKVYWANETDDIIRSVNWDGTGKADVTDFSSSSASYHSLHFYAKTEFLYFVHGLFIFKTPSDGTGVTGGIIVGSILSTAGGGFLTIAKFNGTDHIFFSEQNNSEGFIKRGNFVDTTLEFNSNITTLLTVGGSPQFFSLAIHETTNEIFWFEGTQFLSTVELKRGTLTSTSITGITTILTGIDKGSVGELKVDSLNKRLIFAATIGSVTGIFTTKFDGSDFTVIHTMPLSADRPTGIELIHDADTSAVDVTTGPIEAIEEDIDSLESKFDNPIWDVAADEKGKWLLNDSAANTTVLDASGTPVNNGILEGGKFTNAVSVSGQVGLAFNLDGLVDRINTNSIIGDISSDTKGTMDGWYEPADVTQDGMFFSISDASAFTVLHYSMGANGKIFAFCRQAGVTQWSLFTVAVHMVNGIFKHVSLEHNGTAPVIRVNNILVDITFDVPTTKSAWCSALTGLDTARIGSRKRSGLADEIFFKGKVDTIRYINRDRTSAERDGIFNGGAGIESSQSATYTRNGPIVEDRTLLTSGSATVTNNHNVISALIADLQSKKVLG